MTRIARCSALVGAMAATALFASSAMVKEEGEKGGLSWLSLVPRDEGGASFRSARLAFGDAGLEKMIVVDAVGQRTEIGFSQWQRNPAFPASTFKYTPPKGVDVIGG